MIFHKYVLFIEFKLILKVCNLNTIDNQDLGSSLIKILIKLLIVNSFFIIAIFLIEKINFPSPKKNYDIDVTNDIKKALKIFFNFNFFIFSTPFLVKIKLIFGKIKKIKKMSMNLML